MDIKRKVQKREDQSNCRQRQAKKPEELPYFLWSAVKSLTVLQLVRFGVLSKHITNTACFCCCSISFLPLTTEPSSRLTLAGSILPLLYLDLVPERHRTRRYQQTNPCLPSTCASRIFITSSFSFISSLETSSFERLAISCAIFVSHSCQRKSTVFKPQLEGHDTAPQPFKN